MPDFKTACYSTVAQCPDEYAKAYAKAGINMTDPEEIKVQCLHILSNMSHWRGPLAKSCREVFKRYAEGKTDRGGLR